MLHCWKWQISKKFPCNFNYEAPDPSCMVNGEIRQTFTLYSNLEVLEENSSPSSWFPGGWKMSKTYHTWMILVKTWSRERFPRKSQSGKEEMMFPFFFVGQGQKLLAPLIACDSAWALFHISFLNCSYWLQRQSARSQSSLQRESRDWWWWKSIVNDRPWEKSCILNFAKEK